MGKQLVLDTVSDLVSDFTYYDRKEDEDLSQERLNNLIKTGEVTIDEIVDKFRTELVAVYEKEDS